LLSAVKIPALLLLAIPSCVPSPSVPAPPNKLRYQSRVKPRQTALNLEALKE